MAGVSGSIKGSFTAAMNGTSGYLRPVKKQMQISSSVINFYAYFIAPVATEVKTFAKTCSKGNHALNLLFTATAFVGYIIADQASAEASTSDKHPASATPWQQTAAKVVNVILIGLLAVDSAAEVNWIDSEALRKFTFGSFPVFGLAVSVTVIASASFSLWNVMKADASAESLSPEEQNKRWWAIADAVKTIGVVVLAMGLTAAGQSAAPVYLTAKFVASATDIVSSAKYLYTCAACA